MKRILISVAIVISIIIAVVFMKSNNVISIFNTSEDTIFYRLDDDLTKLEHDLNLFNNFNNYLNFEDLCNEKYSNEIREMGQYMIDSNDYFVNSKNEDVILEFEKVRDQFAGYAQIGKHLVAISDALDKFDYTSARVETDKLIVYVEENYEIFEI